MALSATLEALGGRDNPSMVYLHHSEEVVQTLRRSVLDKLSLAGSADLKTPPGLPIRTTYDIATLPRPEGASENAQELLKEKGSLKGKEILKEKELPEDELAEEEELKKRNLRRERLRKLALEPNPFEDRDPYTLTLEPSITEQTIPIVKANVVLSGLAKDGLGLEERLDMADMVWDTGAHLTIICEELLSEPFRQYLKGSEHDQFRNPRGTRLKMEAMIGFSNSPINLCAIVYVIPQSHMPNQWGGILFGQRHCLNRLSYRSIPRRILQADGADVDKGVWGDIVLDRYIDIYGKFHAF